MPTHKSGRRHLSRQTALQVLYAATYLQKDMPLDSVAERAFVTEKVKAKNWTAFARELVLATQAQASALDARIEKALQNWKIDRLPKLDHLLLRLALCEMQTFPDIPIRVTLNEYIELAKDFGTDESAAFVNGTLDTLSKDFPQKDFQEEPEDIPQ